MLGAFGNNTRLIVGLGWLYQLRSHSSGLRSRFRACITLLTQATLALALDKIALCLERNSINQCHILRSTVVGYCVRQNSDLQRASICTTLTAATAFGSDLAYGGYSF